LDDLLVFLCECSELTLYVFLTTRYFFYRSIYSINTRTVHCAGSLMHGMKSSDVNKDLGLKIRAKAQDLDPKAKTKAQGLESQGQGRETQGQGLGSQGQGQGLKISRSNFSVVFLHRFLLLKCCGCFYVRILFCVLTACCQFMNKWICYCC